MDPAPADSLSILLADDHTLIGDALAHVFKTAGYIVERISDGVAAFDRIASAVDQFDALIADHCLPKLDGVRLVEALRGVGFTGRILVFNTSLSPVELEQYRHFKAETVVVDRPEAERMLAIVKTLHRSGK